MLPFLNNLDPQHSIPSKTLFKYPSCPRITIEASVLGIHSNSFLLSDPRIKLFTDTVIVVGGYCSVRIYSTSILMVIDIYTPLITLTVPLSHVDQDNRPVSRQQYLRKVLIRVLLHCSYAAPDAPHTCYDAHLNDLMLFLFRTSVCLWCVV